MLEAALGGWHDPGIRGSYFLAPHVTLQHTGLSCHLEIVFKMGFSSQLQKHPRLQGGGSGGGHRVSSKARLGWSPCLDVDSLIGCVL